DIPISTQRGNLECILIKKSMQGVTFTQALPLLGEYASVNTWFAVWPAAVVKARSVPLRIDKKLPDVSWRIGAICQLPSTFCSVPLENFGVFMTMFNVK